MLKDLCGFAPSGFTVEALGAGRAALIGWPPLAVAGGPGAGHGRTLRIEGDAAPNWRSPSTAWRWVPGTRLHGLSITLTEPFSEYVHISEKTPKEGVRICHRSFQRSVRMG